MRSFVISVSVVGFVVFCLLLTPATGQYTIWHSPSTFFTDDARLTISLGIPSTAIRVTTSATGDLQWIKLGLVIPSNVRIDSVVVCYQLNSSSSFISQVRLTETTTPDVAYVYHDDGTDLTDPGATCYSSFVEDGHVAGGAITLALRLNFASTSDWIDIGGIGIKVGGVGIQESEEEMQSSSILQNYPNPFRDVTRISYLVSNEAPVVVKIYDAVGRLTKTLEEGNKEPGSYTTYWNGSDENGKQVPSGTYFYQLRIGEHIYSRKAIAIK